MSLKRRSPKPAFICSQLAQAIYCVNTGEKHCFSLTGTWTFSFKLVLFAVCMISQSLGALLRPKKDLVLSFDLQNELL